MTDIDKFHEWVESQSPLALREYMFAQEAWQVRGELDAGKIVDLKNIIVNQGEMYSALETKLDKAREALNSCIGGDDYYNRPIIEKALGELAK